MNVTITINHNSINEHDTDSAYVCQHCGEVFDDDYDLESVNMSDGTTEEWCEDCRDRFAYYCYHCNEWNESGTTTVKTLDGYRWTTEEWCQSCVDSDATECEHCGEMVDDRYTSNYYTHEYGYANICDNCREDEFVSCYRCGDLVLEENAVWCERDDEYYCPDCAPSQSENLHDYGHTHGSYFWLSNGTKVSDWALTAELANRLYLGVELETDNNDDAGDLADDIAREFDEDRIVCKEDGSLHDNGVEIVSQPMEPGYHIESGMWERIAEIVRSHGGESHDAGTCGLHIHMSRSYFDDSHDAAYRIDRLFHRFKKEMVNFSRRTDFYYCRLEDDDLAGIESVEERKKVWYEKKRFANRYQAVNDDNWNPTIELRLWRGTLNMETFKATVELTAGIAIVCKTMSDELADTLTWGMVKTLVRFALEQNGISHAELDSYLVRRGL